MGIDGLGTETATARGGEVGKPVRLGRVSTHRSGRTGQQQAEYFFNEENINLRPAAEKMCISTLLCTFAHGEQWINFIYYENS